MKYERFEDLPVWKDAIELARRVYELTKDPFFNQPGDLRGQPAKLDDEKRALIYRMYELFPQGHPQAGRRRLLLFPVLANRTCSTRCSLDLQCCRGRDCPAAELASLTVHCSHVGDPQPSLASVASYSM